MSGREVLHLSRPICPEALAVDALPLLAELRPAWPPHLIAFKKFTDGITNTLVGCYLEKDESDTILIRIYGQNTDLLIDREAEKINFKILSASGFAPKLYAVFGNGLAYEYVEGDVLTKETVCADQVYPQVAGMMAGIHSLNDPALGPPQPVLWPRVDKYIGLIPLAYSRPQLQTRFVQLFPDGVEGLKKEAASLRQALSSEQSEVVFCHNDLLLANVVLGKNKVTFIDYEYAAYNYQAFDIGNHFAEFAGVTDVDYDLYPDKKSQEEWLRIYLKELRDRRGSAEPVTESDVEALYRTVNKFALSSHILWTAWALVQANHSDIDFDYIGYAGIRMKEYHRRKNSFLAL